MKKYFFILPLLIFPTTLVFGQDHPMFFAEGSYIFNDFAGSEIYDYQNPLILKKTEKFLSDNKEALSSSGGDIHVPKSLVEKYFLPKMNQKLWAFSYGGTKKHKDPLYLGTTEPKSFSIDGSNPENQDFQLFFTVDFDSLKEKAEMNRIRQLNMGGLLLVWVPENTKAEDQPRLTKVSDADRDRLLKEVSAGEASPVISLALTAMGAKYIVVNISSSGSSGLEIYKVLKKKFLLVYSNSVAIDE